MWARTTSRRSTPYSSTGGEPGPRKRGILSDILILVIPFASGPAKNESFLWVISWRRGTARSAGGSGCTTYPQLPRHVPRDTPSWKEGDGLVSD